MPLEEPQPDDTATPDITNGPLDVVRSILRNAGVASLSGIKGLSELPNGTDAASKAISDYQAKYGNTDLNPNGQSTIRDYVAPFYNGVKTALHTSDLGSAYGEGSSRAADLAGKYLGPTAGGLTQAAAAVAPMMITPGGMLGKEASSGLEATVPKTTEDLARAYDGSTVGAIEREGEAARRSGDTGHSISQVDADQEHYPASAVSFAAHDPSTGSEVGRITAIPRGDFLQTVDSAVDPQYQSQGIGTSLLRRVVDHAHANDMDYGSDLSVSPQQMAVYMRLKQKGYPVNLNPSATEEQMSHGDMALVSGNGQPVVRIPRPVDSDEATTDEIPQFDPNNFYKTQAGEVQGHPLQHVADTAAQNGGVTYHPGTGVVNPPSGYSVSLYKPREQVQGTAPTAQDISDYIGKNQDAFDADPQAHFGHWHNTENGQHYLDVANVDPDLDSAMGKAKANNQEAIFNLSNFETIPNPDYQATGEAPGAAPGGMAEGGEASALLDPVESMISKYAATPPNAHAGMLADQVANEGAVTYNPTSGDVHTGGYAVPTEPSRSVAINGKPDADDIHDFVMNNQDAFQADPKAAVHIESDPDTGDHFMHVAHIEPDFQGAMAAAQQFDAPGVREIHTGTNFPTAGSSGIGAQDSDPAVEDYLAGSKIPGSNLPHEIDTDRNQRPSASWTHGEQTVTNPQRNAFPGIYNDPRKVISDANQMVGPEDPLLQQLFGVSRQDLSDIAQGRQGNDLGVLPGAKLNGTGAASAQGVMNPQNEQRLIDVLSEARGTPLHTGMTGWYSMDPLYERFKQIFGEDDAPAKYAKFNTLMGMASPGSDVGTEIARGTSANWLNNQGRFQDFVNYAGVPGAERPGMPNFPQDMAGVPGHVYHQTAQATPMSDYLRTGSMQMKSPKVPMYIGASGVPDIGVQSDMPVGDAHWARGVGLADTRNPRYMKGQQIVPGSSVSTPEMQTLGPWWRDRVAAQAGYQAVPAQATAWGAFAPYTGVESAIGAPKLEILSTQIGKLASRLGVSPETARDLVIRGDAGAY
jgi:GNAT superfamily N-acetyltransferase